MPLPDERLLPLPSPRMVAECTGWSLEITLWHRGELLDRAHLHDPTLTVYLTRVGTGLRIGPRRYGILQRRFRPHSPESEWPLAYLRDNQWFITAPPSWAMFTEPPPTGVDGETPGLHLGFGDQRLTVRWVPLEDSSFPRFRPAWLDLHFLRDLSLSAMMLTCFAPLALPTPQTTHVAKEDKAARHMSMLLRTLDQQPTASLLMDIPPALDVDTSSSRDLAMLFSLPGPPVPGDATIVAGTPFTPEASGPSRIHETQIQARSPRTGGGGTGSEAFPSGDEAEHQSWGQGNLRTACASPDLPCAPTTDASRSFAHRIAPPPLLAMYLDARRAIDEVLEQHLTDMEECVEQMDVPPGRDEGNIQIRLVVGMSGRALHSDVHLSTLNNPGFERCLADTIRVLSFPRPAHGILVDYPRLRVHLETTPQSVDIYRHIGAYKSLFAAHLELTPAEEPSRLAGVRGD